MALNRYDTPAQAQFINTYVPIPFDAMMKAAAMKQQMVEENDRAAAEVVGALSTFQVAPFDEQNYINIRNEYTKRLNDVLNNSAPGSYEVKKNIMNLRTQMAMDPTLRGMQYNLGQYTNAMKELSDAKNASATDANRYELEKSLRDITQIGGTVGLMKQTGGSKWTPGSWYKNVDIAPAVESYIDNVAESSNQFDSFQQDSKGAYIIDKSQAGRSLNALAAPFGLTYQQEKDKTTGKLGYKLVDAGGATRVMADFLQSPAGEQLLRDAKMEAGRTGGDVMKIATEKYFSMVGSKINERVNTKGEYNISYDPKWLADYNRAQEDKQIQLTTGMLMGIPKGDLTSQKDVFKAEAGFTSALADVDKREAAYRNRRDVIALSKGPGTGGYNLDDEGKDVSLVLKEFDAERAQIKRDQEDLQSKMYRARQEAGVQDDWQVEADLLNKHRNESFQSLLQGNTQVDYVEHLKEKARIHANSLYGTGASQEEHDRAYQDKYEELLLKESGTYRKINEVLKRDAQASSELVGVTSLPSKELDTYLSDKFIAWAAPGGTSERRIGGGAIRLQNMRTGEDFTDKEYAKISGEKKPVVAGITYSPRDRSMKVVYRTYDRKGVLNKDAVVADAPEGLAGYLVKNGYTNEVTVALNQQVPNIENSRSKTGTIGLNGIDIEVHKLTETEKQNAPAGTNFYITPKGTSFKTVSTGPDGKPVTGGTTTVPTTYTASSMGEVLNWYINNLFIPNSKETIPTK